MTQLFGHASGAQSARVSNQNHIGLEYTVGNNGTANVFTPVICNFNNYSNTTTYKTILSRTNHASEPSSRVGTQVALWRSTSAITSIEIAEVIGTTWAVGSTFTLYGIKAA